MFLGQASVEGSLNKHRLDWSLNASLFLPRQCITLYLQQWTSLDQSKLVTLDAFLEGMIGCFKLNAPFNWNHQHLIGRKLECLLTPIKMVHYFIRKVIMSPQDQFELATLSDYPKKKVNVLNSRFLPWVGRLTNGEPLTPASLMDEGLYASSLQKRKCVILLANL